MFLLEAVARTKEKKEKEKRKIEEKKLKGKNKILQHIYFLSHGI